MCNMCFQFQKQVKYQILHFILEGQVLQTLHSNMFVYFTSFVSKKKDEEVIQRWLESWKGN